MKYSELVKIRADKLYKEGILTYKEYAGSWGWFSRKHICWYQCVNDRNCWYKCEECGRWDEERKPYEE